MKGGHMLSLRVVFILLLSSVAVLARDRTGISFNNILPILTGAGGVLATLLGIMPLILRMRETLKDAAQYSETFAKKYKNEISQDELKQDLRQLFRRYDAVTEAGADILARVQMRRAARWLRALIPDGGRII
jgi:hypothetical protein